MVEDLLPIGSVVLLKDGQKRIMIFGIKQTDADNDDIEYDYVGVLYPEGNLGAEYQFLFNKEDIFEVFFRGYEDEERVEFINKLKEFYV
ncbi:DUF4176 domain-containing protein [Candidatus Contubernalis alkaliaceticus]|uniref:DUF4176 domain-containing protein n=1 Tax=Candidatus Contubernalis alkaliaceticus TaxID=338645 RepID=UPI001F4BEDF7|nr:DUF4176 domain-containing protein [Candidatus Contubernalis alkalaceticus]UNC91125.1 DUF4176 domain-containing protein [Candidatus Contubernalis alkalaceticus]